jgi:hypothetical protein
MGTRVETIVRGRYRHSGALKTETKDVTRIRKSTLAAAMVASAIMLAAGCMQTQEMDQTMPPYASISDEGRDPPPKPAPSDDSPGIMSRIGSAVLKLFW